MWRLVDGLMEPIVRLDGQESWSLPRQSLPQVYWQNGYVDIIRPRVILDAGSMTGVRVLPLVMDEPIYELDYPEQIADAAAALEALAGGEVRPAPRPGRHAV
jgi:hypothetical protein